MLPHKTDSELISHIKAFPEKCHDEINEIINRHSGIFVDMVSKLVPKSNTFCSKSEILEERNHCIYESIMTYNENKGAKFSTHLANRAKWLCLRSYNKTKGKPILPSSHIPFDTSIDMGGGERKNENPMDSISKKDMFSYINKIISKLPDKRATKILRMRYIEGKGNKLMPWREISEEMNLSKQACIDIHNKTLIKIRNKVKTC